MQDQIRDAITKILIGFGITPVHFSVEHPTELAHGDYSTNVALKIFGPLSHETNALWTIGRPAEELKEFGNPRECAERIRGELEKHKPAGVEKIEIAGPGFINFHLSREFFSDRLKEVLETGDGWGGNDTLAGKKILIEYTSPNLFKPLHIGNLMSNIVGESLARLSEFAGAKVKRFNYPSDIGLTVAKGVWALQRSGGDPGNIETLGAAYRDGNAAYEDDPSAKAEIDAVNKKLYAGEDEQLNALRGKGIATSLEHVHALCEVLGTAFDIERFESESGPKGKEIVLAHIEDGIFERSDGAVIFKGEAHGLHTRVFINSAGLPTYEAKDLGLAAIKREIYPFDLSVVTTAVEQNEYFKVVIKTIETVFPALAGKVRHVGYGFLTLTTGKMSSRKGNVITGESLLRDMRDRALEKMRERPKDGEGQESIADAVAVAAIKYMVLRQETSRNIVFDPDRSLSFEGDSGPYLQYTHARIASILRKADAEGVAPSTIDALEDISVVERVLNRFPFVIERAQKEYEPHYVTTYLTELASMFNSWYAEVQIVNSDDKYSPYKIALAQAVAQTLKNGLWCLGIRAPERM